MSDLHITWVDIAVAAILLASTIFAIYRGFVRETLSIFAWAAAAFATLYFGHFVVPLLKPHMSLMLAQVLAYTAVFVLVLMPLLFVGSRFAARVHESSVGALDRVLGALFGIVRALVVVAIAYVLYSLVVPVPVQAKWMKEARSLPLIQKSADALLALLPQDDAQYLDSRAHRSGRAAADGDISPDTESSKDRHPSAHHSIHRNAIHKGYGAADRRALDHLIETTGDSGGSSHE
jgi:membrane protein required for colicin V production